MEERIEDNLAMLFTLVRVVKASSQAELTLKINFVLLKKIGLEQIGVHSRLLLIKIPKNKKNVHVSKKECKQE